MKEKNLKEKKKGGEKKENSIYVKSLNERYHGTTGRTCQPVAMTRRGQMLSAVVVSALPCIPFPLLNVEGGQKANKKKNTKTSPSLYFSLGAASHPLAGLLSRLHLARYPCLPPIGVQISSPVPFSFGLDHSRRNRSSRFTGWK